VRSGGRVLSAQLTQVEWTWVISASLTAVDGALKEVSFTNKDDPSLLVKNTSFSARHIDRAAPMEDARSDLPHDQTYQLYVRVVAAGRDESEVDAC
jgi:hypothetical protein